jgi:hypothetical protein
MSAQPPNGSDQPEAIDQVMLAVLSNPGREARALSPDEEHLLDDWLAGRLDPEAAARAAALVKRNSIAAEHVLERRLLDAARRSPAVPRSFEARILKSAVAPTTSTVGAWWRSLGRRQWIGIASVVAAACIAVLAVAPVLQQTMREGAPVQVALATFSDRTPLFEASDTRVRGTAPQPPAADQRFHDVEIPTSILSNLIATAGRPTGAASRDIESYLPAVADNGKGPLRIVIDSALKDRIEGSERRESQPVRVYDLKDPRTADIRRAIPGVPTDTRAYLLTLRP